MPQPLSGPGLGLPLPQNLYPPSLYNGEFTSSTNDISLAPGEAIPVPAGRFIISLGKYCSVQYLDPVTTEWTFLRDLDNNDGNHNVWSDGFNLRIANLTGCVVGAVVTNGGSGYTAGTTTITPSTGNSAWTAVVGGSLAAVTVTNVGAGYGVAPIVSIDAPPSPGVPATAVATIANGTVTTITLLNVGGGYKIAPNVTLVPNPADPNLASGSITTQAVATVTSLTNAGAVTGALLTNNGAPVASTMSLTVAGSGTTATIVPLFLNTLVSATLSTVGAGYGSATQVASVGGWNTNVPAITNPQISKTGFVPRPAQASVVVGTGTITSVNTVYDGGLYLATPTFFAMTNGIVTTAAVFVPVMGSQNDTVRITPLA